MRSFQIGLPPPQIPTSIAANELPFLDMLVTGPTKLETHKAPLKRSARRAVVPTRDVLSEAHAQIRLARPGLTWHGHRAHDPALPDLTLDEGDQIDLLNQPSEQRKPLRPGAVCP